MGARVLLPNPEIYAESQLNFVVGEDYNIDKVVKVLSNVGYQKYHRFVIQANLVGVVISLIFMR